MAYTMHKDDLCVQTRHYFPWAESQINRHENAHSVKHVGVLHEIVD